MFSWSVSENGVVRSEPCTAAAAARWSPGGVCVRAGGEAALQSLSGPTERKHKSCKTHSTTAEAGGVYLITLKPS